MQHEKVIDKLNDLIQLDVDAVGAYDQAIKACDTALIREKLTEFQGDHQRHITELSQEVNNLGGQPKVKRDVKGFFIQGFTAIASQGDRSALTAMRGNEELTNKTYKSAVEEQGFPASVATLVAKNFADEQRHLSWIKDALDRRIWETRAA